MLFYVFAARAMAVESITGNVYFADEDTGYIYVMNENGKFLKTLVTTESSPNTNSIINDMAIDSKNGLVTVR